VSQILIDIFNAWATSFNENSLARNGFLDLGVTNPVSWFAVPRSLFPLIAASVFKGEGGRSRSFVFRTSTIVLLSSVAATITWT
jgi:hypothetical protein